MLYNFLKGLRGRVLILSHYNTDVDGVCSSIAFKEAVHSLNPGLKITLGTVGSFSRLVVNPSIDADFIVLMDTSTMQQLAPLDADIREHPAKKAVIDHHNPHKDTKKVADFYFVDKSATSTSEVVYKLLCDMGVKISRRMGYAVLLGILADSAHLKFASSKTMKMLSEILDKNVDYGRAVSLLEVTENTSRRLAHLKAAQRMKVYKAEKFVIATSKVGSFGSSAASALVVLGADCAFVASGDKEVQISARAHPKFLESGMSLGKDVMLGVGKLMGGAGGGHDAAAGAAGKKLTPDEALDECVKVVESFLKSRKGR